jgi:signal transduction histidine kinase
MGALQPSILLVSDNPEFCDAARREFAAEADQRRVSAVRSVDAARRIVEESTPAVILLEDSSVFAAAGRGEENKLKLNSIVSALAVHAPVVVIGGRERQNEIAPLLASGAADFVERADNCLRQVVSRVEERLKHSRAIVDSVKPRTPVTDDQTFGEVLRHELNNPLTGILGNAELLLAEVRRRNDGLMPRGGMQRLETIASLAVRLRETVRRLSQEWESGNHGSQ